MPNIVIISAKNWCEYDVPVFLVLLVLLVLHVGFSIHERHLLRVV